MEPNTNISKEMKDLIQEVFAKKNWAVVGAHPNEEKFGNKIYKKLMNQGFNVFLVNPKHKEIDNIKTYSSIKDIDDTVDCISMVVNPTLARVAVEEAIEKQINYIWFQPHTYDDELIKFAEDNGIKTIHGTCVLLN